MRVYGHYWQAGQICSRRFISAKFAIKTGLNKSALGRYERDLNFSDAKAIEAIVGAF